MPIAGRPPSSHSRHWMRGRSSAATGVALALELFAIAAPLFQQMVVDEVLTAGDRDLLTVLTLGFALLLIVQTLVGLARSWMVILLGQSLYLQWTSNVFAHLVRLPVSYFEKRHLGDITSRFGSVQSIQRTLSTAVIEAVLDGVMAIAALVMMLVYAPTLAAVTVAAVVLYGLLRWASYGPFRNAAAERLVVAAKESTHFLETLRAISPLKLFGREEERRARWQNLIVEVQNRDLRTARMSLWFSTANTFLFGAENLLVLWLGAKLIMDGMSGGGASSGAGMTIGMLFAFISYKGQFSGRVSALINYAVDLKMLGLHAERLADLCLEPPEKDDIPANDLAHLAPSIELRGVSFRYSEGERWILKDANFSIAPGESVAVVGASGAGKTTLLKIALGLLQPSEGEVLYGGQVGGGKSGALIALPLRWVTHPRLRALVLRRETTQLGDLLDKADALYSKVFPGTKSRQTGAGRVYEFPSGATIRFDHCQHEKDAKRYEHLSYDQVIERKLNVMDTAAIALCRENNLPLRIYDIGRPGDLMRIMKGQQVGTLVDSK